MKAKNKLASQIGFTLVELLIVIVIAGIVALLILITSASNQQTVRNTERQTDTKIVGSYLEIYKTKNNHYPTLANLNDATFVSTELKGLDKESTRDPKAGTAESDYQFVSGDATSQKYGYTPTKDDGTTCDNAIDGSKCTKFTLSYIEEGGTKKTVNNP